MFESLTSVLVFCLAIPHSLSVCPKSVEPCVCRDSSSDYSQIFCGETENIDLEKIFENIDKNLTNSEKYFKLFLLNKTAINELKNSYIFESINTENCYDLSKKLKNNILGESGLPRTYFTYKEGSTKLNYAKIECRSGQCSCPFDYSIEKCRIESTCISECNERVDHCFEQQICDCIPSEYLSKNDCGAIVNCTLPDLCLNGGQCKEEEDGYYCVCSDDYKGVICEEKARTPMTAVLVLIVIMGCLLIIAILVLSFVYVRKVKKARATRGHYSPSTEEMFDNSAVNALKPPPVERLI